MITPMLCNAKSTALKPYVMPDETDMPKQQIETVQKEPSKKPIRKITGKIPAAALIALLTAGGLTGCSSDNNIKKDDSRDARIERLEFRQAILATTVLLLALMRFKPESEKK